MFGVWATALPRDLVGLSSKHPPARAYVMSVLDQIERSLTVDVSGSGASEKLARFHDMALYVELNRQLGTTSRSVATLDEISGRAELQWYRDAFAGLIFDELYERGRFADILMYKETYKKALIRRVAWPDKPWDGASLGAEAFPGRFYAVLLKQGDPDRAWVADWILRRPTPGSVARLVTIAVEAGARKEARELHSRGQRGLTDEGRARLKGLLPLP